MTKDLPQKVTFEILGESASAMSIWQFSADEIWIHEPGTVMIHRPWTIAMGGEDEFAGVLSYLKDLSHRAAGIYVAGTGQTEERIQEMMKATTWMNSEEALELGFVHKIIPNKAKVDASPRLQKYKNLPAHLSDEINALPETIEARKHAIRELQLKKAKLSLICLLYTSDAADE